MLEDPINPSISGLSSCCFYYCVFFFAPQKRATTHDAVRVAVDRLTKTARFLSTELRTHLRARVQRSERKSFGSMEGRLPESKIATLASFHIAIMVELANCRGIEVNPEWRALPSDRSAFSKDDLHALKTWSDGFPSKIACPMTQPFHQTE